MTGASRCVLLNDRERWYVYIFEVFQKIYPRVHTRFQNKRRVRLRTALEEIHVRIEKSPCLRPHHGGFMPVQRSKSRSFIVTLSDLKLIILYGCYMPLS